MVLFDIIVNKVENNEDIVLEGLLRLVSDYIDGFFYVVVNFKKLIKKFFVVSYMLLVSYFVDELC